MYTFLRIGQGFDSHNIQIVKNTVSPLILGGIIVDSDLEVVAHSDGDVLLHSLIDAFLGALALGDIGEWFSNEAIQYKGIASEKLLHEVLRKTYYGKDWEIVNIDLTIIFEIKKLKDLKKKILLQLAMFLNIDTHHLNVKAKTFEDPNNRQIWVQSSVLIQLLKNRKESKNI